jgi:hypothetical protein
VLERSFKLGSPKIEAPVRPLPLESLDDSI